MGEGDITHNDLKRVWATILQIKDDVRASRIFLEGGIGPDGQHREGMITDHNRLKAEVAEIKEAQARGGERRWVISAGVIGAAIAKGLDVAIAYLTAKGGNHP